MRSIQTLAALALAATLAACGGSGPDGPGASGWLAFLGDYETPDQVLLYAVRAEEGTPIDMTGFIVPTGDVFDTGHMWSPDGTLLAFISDRDIDGRRELFVADPAAGTVQKVSGALPWGGNVVVFAWAPDSTKLAFLADGSINDVEELYVVSAAGGPRTKASGLMVSGGNVGQVFHWSPDSTRIAYVADAAVDQTWEGYVYDLVADTRWDFTAFTLAGSQLTTAFEWSSSGARIAFIADRDVDNRFELYVAPGGGGAPSKRSGALVSGGQVSSFYWSPDGTRLVYIADQEVDNQHEAYLVLASGAIPDSITPPFAGFAVVTCSPQPWSPDSAYFAFLTDADGNGARELWVASVATGAPTHLAGNGMHVSDVGLASWSPDSAWLAYVHDDDNDDRQELHVCRPLGADHEILSAEAQVGYTTDGLKWSPDSGLVAYRANETGNFELFVARPQDAGGPLQISDAAASGGDVSPLEWNWLRNGSGVACVEQSIGGPGRNLFVWDLSSGAYTQLVPSPTPGGRISYLRIP